MIIGITGATGFVGKHLLAKLNIEKYVTRALVRDISKETSAAQKVQGDLETGAGLGEFVSGVDVVINLVGRFQPPFRNQVVGNAINLENLCSAAVKAGVKKIIHISAAAVYGIPQNGQKFTEYDCPMPDTTYALSKYMAENVADYYHRNFGMSFVILRPPNIYGPESDHGVVYNFITSVRKTGGVVIHGDGTQKRDFLYVGDFVDAIVKSVNYETEYEIFNITTAEPREVNELATTLNSVMDAQFRIIHHGKEQGARIISADNTKAKKELHWLPETTLENGLVKTITP